MNYDSIYDILKKIIKLKTIALKIVDASTVIAAAPTLKYVFVFNCVLLQKKRVSWTWVEIKKIKKKNAREKITQ